MRAHARKIVYRKYVGGSRLGVVELWDSVGPKHVRGLEK